MIHLLRKYTRLAHEKRGFGRIAEAIRRRYASGPQTVAMNDFDGDLNFSCDLSEHIASHIYWYGFHSHDQLALLDKILRKDMVFLDIGANQGEFTVFAAKRLPQGKVLAFEPASDNFQKLTGNVQSNGFTNVELVNLGLGTEDKQVEIYGDASRFSDGSYNKGLYTQFQTAERSHKIDTIHVVPLDAYLSSHPLPRLDVVKIDVEGSELNVIRGGLNTLGRYKPVIFLEVSSETSEAAGYQSKALLDELEAIDYRFELVESCGNAKTRPLTADQLTSFQNIVCYPI